MSVKGMVAAGAHADSRCDGWTYFAAVAIGKAVAENHPCTAAMARSRCAHIPAPPDERAWGAAVKKAEKFGFIRKTGKFVTDSFGSPKPLWQAV